ncbi:alpha/beta fold hydrolase [Colwelliaceae bacterium 6471]
MSFDQLSAGIKVSGQGPAVILLHSSLSSSRQWLLLVSLLKEHFTVINIDLLGYGQAPVVSDPKCYDFTVELTRINDAIAKVIGAEQYHLVGHSCGGAIALKLAVEQPYRLKSLALYEPVAFHLLPKNSKQRLESDHFAQQVLQEEPYKAAEIFTNFWNKEGFFNALPLKMQQLMAADMPKVNLDFKGLIAEKYTLADLGVITCPSLLMKGDRSPSLSQDLTMNILHGLPDAKLQVFSAGHMAPVSHSEEVHPAIADFITQV